MSDTERNRFDDADSWDEDDSEARKPLFNDIFGVRGDYMKGKCDSS
jgi:hypothetical protein